MTPERESEIRAIFDRDFSTGWRAALGVWELADTVYTMPVGPNFAVPEPYLFVQLIVKNIDRFEADLISSVTCSNPVVAAYCIATLERCDRLRLSDIQIKQLSNRTEVINVVGGCFGTNTTLARFLKNGSQSLL
jgi:hypothetical protein